MLPLVLAFCERGAAGFLSARPLRGFGPGFLHPGPPAAVGRVVPPSAARGFCGASVESPVVSVGSPPRPSRPRRPRWGLRGSAEPTAGGCGPRCFAPPRGWLLRLLHPCMVSSVVGVIGFQAAPLQATTGSPLAARIKPGGRAVLAALCSRRLVACVHLENQIHTAQTKGVFTMQIYDRAESRPIMMNTSTAFVWEVILYDWDYDGDCQVENIVAVFYDPWKAVQYGIRNHGVGFNVFLSTRKV